MFTGVSWQAVLTNIIHGGAIVRVKGQADQCEDQSLQKTTPEMQIVKHDECLLWLLFPLSFPFLFFSQSKITGENYIIAYVVRPT